MNIALLNKILTGGASLLKKAAFFATKSKDFTDFCEAFFYISPPEDTAPNPYFPQKQSDLFGELILLVIGFDHKKGSIIEYIYPEKLNSEIMPGNENSEFFNKICFSSIPDAAHILEDDYAFLMIPYKNSVFYGVTCFRQVGSFKEDSNIPHRPCIQKAVCIISQAPLFSVILNKLHPTTHAYFNQGNFTDHSVFLA